LSSSQPVTATRSLALHSTPGWQNMRVRLKGIHSSHKRLADGTIRVYHYAWRGGPQLPGQPGSPEFIAAYNAAVATKVALPSGLLISVLSKYQQSDDFRRLADRTRKDYGQNIKVIERKFGDFPLTALSDRRTRGVFLAWRDKLAMSSPRQADYVVAVLSTVLSWGLDRGLVSHNPCERAGRTYRGTRVDRIWTAGDEQAFYARAPAHLHLPLMLALWTGQRKGDLLRLPWSAYDGTYIRLRQSKTGARVTIPVGAPLKAALDAAARTKSGPLILINPVTGHPWTANSFGCAWRVACRAVGIKNLTFHDLRGTSVTRLAVAGATESEIATVTGHSLRDVHRILDRHYLHRDPALAESAIRKLERSRQGTNSTN
jgi:integrase